MKCSSCSSTNTYVKNYHHYFKCENKSIEFDFNRRFCSKCNSLVYDDELDNIASKKALGIDDGKFDSFNKNSFDSFSEYNGYTEFILEKLNNLILMLSRKRISKTKLLIEMFYCDFMSYKNIGSSITGLEYVKVPFGIVPNDYGIILNSLLQNDYISYELDSDDDYGNYFISNSCDINKSLFTEDELQIISNVMKYFERFTEMDIINYSCKEKAFTETDETNKISYDYAFDIKFNF